MEYKDKTNATRQARHKEKRRAAGLVRVEVWVKPEHVEAIKAFADKIAKPLDTAHKTL